MELGASIFVKANKNLWRATEEFNLSLADFGSEDSEMGIWDGAKFRFRVSASLRSITRNSSLIPCSGKTEKWWIWLVGFG